MEVGPYEIDVRRMKRKFRNLVKPKLVEYCDENTGEIYTCTQLVGDHVYSDTTDFVKLYSVRDLLKLSKVGMAVLLYIMNILRFESFVRFNYTDCMKYTGYNNRASLYRGVKELLDYDFIRVKQPKEYWVNPNIFFKGDRGLLLRKK